MRADDVEIFERRPVATGFVTVSTYRLRFRRFDGSWTGEVVRDLCERGEAVAVLPYDAGRDAVLLVEQFRTGALHDPESPWLIEPVAGVMEAGEQAADVAAREAHEEAGLIIDALDSVAFAYPSPGILSERVHHFIGRADLSAGTGLFGNDHEHEDIRTHIVPADEAIAWAGDGRVRTATGVITLLWLALHRERLRSVWRQP